MKPLELACPTCRALKGQPCKTYVIGGGSHHNERVKRAEAWDAAVAGMRKKAKAAADAKKRKGPIVEPIGSDGLEGFIRAVKCPTCKVPAGTDCESNRVKWHGPRRKRGETAMIRARGELDNE
ncbi:zinc finger domain-containing protein [Nocardiopsis dassonvillei]